MKANLQSQYAAKLLAMGYAEIDSGSTKTRLFEKASSGGAYVWLGMNGGARYANLRRMDASVPFSAKSKAILIAKGVQS